MATPMSAAEFKAALIAEGCNVREHDPSWSTHNRNHKGAWGPLNGVMIHHTGGLNAEGFVWSGSSDLPGPLCHAYINKAGEVVLIGWGRTNHAGGGDPDSLAAVIAESYPIPAPNTHDGGAGSVDGNSHFVGYECENRGDGRDPWPDVQLDAMVRATAAVLRHYGWSAGSALRHMDWSDWKSDPKGVDWDWFRAQLTSRLGGAPSDGGHTDPGPVDPQPSDPDAYPGAGGFGPGADNDHVTRLGQMLVARGGGRFYSVGPSSSWGDADRNATAAFQRAQGWSGADADGIPGPTTWDYLVHGRGADIPAERPTVSVSRVAAAARRDPGLSQGGTTYPADVRPVELALARLGHLDADYSGDGSFGSRTVAAYAGFQRSLGYRGADADGIPGRSSLSVLADRTGLFTVTN